MTDDDTLIQIKKIKNMCSEMHSELNLRLQNIVTIYAEVKDLESKFTGKNNTGTSTLKFIGEDAEVKPAFKPAIPYPTLEELKLFAKSDATIIPPECAETFFHDMEGIGWQDKFGRPIAKWQGTLRGYAKRWISFDQSKSTKFNKSGQPSQNNAAPVDEYMG